MPGAGKSTVGRLIARAAGFEFFDLDRQIEAKSGVPIATIFAVEGEAGFRRRESQTLDDLTRKANAVLATGGGAVLAECNRQWLRERGLVIYLEANADELVRRTASDGSRPLLQGGDRRTRIEELLAQRRALYETTAHLTFHSAAAHPRKLVKRILDHLDVQRALRVAPA
jgi:shikimate kinase